MAMRFSLKGISSLIEESLGEPDTGDEWLETRYQEDTPIIGHTNPYYKAFYLIAKKYKPKLTVELGSWRATAAAHIAAGYPSGQVVTIDIHREDQIAQQKTIRAALHYPNLVYINQWSWDAAEEVAGYGPIDILFMDAWHRRDYLEREWRLYEPLLNTKALVIMDGLNFLDTVGGNVVEFWDELEGEKLVDGRIHRPNIPMGFLKTTRKL